MTIDQKVYSPGDFVYYDVPDKKGEHPDNTVVFNCFMCFVFTVA